MLFLVTSWLLGLPHLNHPLPLSASCLLPHTIQLKSKCWIVCECPSEYFYNEKVQNYAVGFEKRSQQLTKFFIIIECINFLICDSAALKLILCIFCFVRSGRNSAFALEYISHKIVRPKSMKSFANEYKKYDCVKVHKL